MDIPDKEALRAALIPTKEFSDVLDEEGLDRNALHMDINRVCEAAEIVLTLLDRIGPDRLRGLLDGSHVVVPVSPSCAMADATFQHSDDDEWNNHMRVCAQKTYHAMIAASQDSREG